jgi:hypothetical protein
MPHGSPGVTAHASAAVGKKANSVLWWLRRGLEEVERRRHHVLPIIHRPVYRAHPRERVADEGHEITQRLRFVRRVLIPKRSRAATSA